MRSNVNGKVFMLLSVNQAAEILGVSEVSIRRFVKEKRIPHRRIGDRILFTESDIEDYLASIKVPAVSHTKEAVNA